MLNCFLALQSCLNDVVMLFIGLLARRTVSLRFGIATIGGLALCAAMGVTIAGMTTAKRIGIIGGNGWLGNAIAQAAVVTGIVDPNRLTLSGRSDKRGAAELPGVHRTTDNDELVRRSDVVVLSVRPEQFAGVRIDAGGKLVISVMAGIAARSIAGRTGASEVVRSIPNAAAAVRRSFTPWYAAEGVTTANRTLVQRLFEACGEAAEVPEEAHID